MNTTVRRKNTKKISPEQLKKKRERDHQMVKGIFRCFQPVGGSMTFSFKEYKGDEVLKYTMIDGEVYTVPRMVARHLNHNCWYPENKHLLDADGKPSIHVGKKVQRCTFESMEFFDEDELEEQE